MARVLAIEDDPDLLEILRYNLGAAKHEVYLAATGADGLRVARERRPEIVLLDMMLPDIPGAEVCKQLKADLATRRARILIVSAKGEEIDRVLGFELGADDYIVKPFSVRELILRIDAVLRRGQPKEEGQVAFGRLRLDREAHRAWVDGEEIVLTALELKLLVTLHDGRNRVRSREELLLDVWGGEADIEARTVDTHVKRLREKLGSAGKYVQTVRGAGYRFAAEPEE